MKYLVVEQLKVQYNFNYFIKIKNITMTLETPSKNKSIHKAFQHLPANFQPNFQPKASLDDE